MSEKQSTNPEPASDASTQLPPASFSSLITMLATQALVALGQMPDPTQNKTVIRLHLARFYIDTLSVLEDKTRGNLVDEEARLLTGLLGDLRMAYITASKK
jgi:hypothetical protein